MFDSIDPRSPTPLYEQIAACVRLAIATGELEAGTALPSVRSLANQLRLNPATVVQAYRELSMEGFVDRRHGAGTFVQEVGADVRAREQQIEAQRIARRALTEAVRSGVSAEDLRKALEEEMTSATASSEASE